MLPKGIESIDDECNLPIFPSPEELMNKFIVKCKSKRLIPACYKDCMNKQHEHNNEGV